MGGGMAQTAVGPVIGDALSLANIFMKFRDDAYNWELGKAHRKDGPFADIWPELFRWGQHHTPFINLIGLKSALDYLAFWHIYNTLSPGWWDRHNRRLQRETGRTIIGYAPGEPPPTLPYGAGGLHGFLPGR